MQHHPLPEYPRPALRRDSYENLNGLWQYAITGSAGLPTKWDGDILVPYSPETKASGVGRTLQPGTWLHYHRSFVPPAGTGGRVLLHFGAVDYACAVQVNGHLVGGHRGGYWPFALDITDALNPAGHDRLWVAVQDPTGTGVQARGKQTLRPGGMFYPAQSGIWQTVWLERVPEKYIKEVETLPEPDEEKVRIIVRSGAEYAVKIVLQKPKIHKELKKNVPDDPVEDMTGSRIADPVESTTETTIGTFYGKTNEWLEIPVQDVQMWTCDTPYLYDFTVEMEKDRVAGYFAMRKFTLEKDGQGFVRICLNYQVQYQNGVLDQGYWPDGLYTAPSDEAMIFDLEQMKKCGFNMVRKHLKIEPQRWYYHCDRIGMLVWQDMVNGGREYKSWYVTWLATAMEGTHIRAKDTRLHLMGRQDQTGQKQFESEMKETIRRLYNHPSVVTWVIFNEGWGQFKTRKMTDIALAEDHTRLIDSASGWFDQGCGDIKSIHDYFFPLNITPEKRVTALTEFGGYSLQIPKHSMYEKDIYGYKIFKRKKDLSRAYEKLIKKLVIPNISRGLSATVYTQLSDIEEEVNGILSYDRKIVKIDENVVREWNEKLHF